jgi:hypothetical protein
MFDLYINDKQYTWEIIASGWLIYLNFKMMHRLANYKPHNQVESLYSICKTSCNVYWPSIWTCATTSLQFSDLLNPYYSWPHLSLEQRLRCLQFCVQFTHTHTHTLHILTWCAELGCSSRSWIARERERESTERNIWRFRKYARAQSRILTASWEVLYILPFGFRTSQHRQ